MKKTILLPLLLALALPTAGLRAEPPVTYTGATQVTATADGGLRPVVGVQNIQVYRANRTHSSHADGLSDTYTHQPMPAWWRSRFYLEFLSAPRVVFPAFALPDGSQTIALFIPSDRTATRRLRA